MVKIEFLLFSLGYNLLIVVTTPSKWRQQLFALLSMSIALAQLPLKNGMKAPYNNPNHVS